MFRFQFDFCANSSLAPHKCGGGAARCWSPRLDPCLHSANQRVYFHSPCIHIYPTGCRPGGRNRKPVYNQKFELYF